MSSPHRSMATTDAAATPSVRWGGVEWGHRHIEWEWIPRNYLFILALLL
jgi:hypothetical protein